MNSSGHTYTNDFYDYISAGSRASASKVVPLVLGQTEVTSVLDVGAGTGSWLATWMTKGVSDALAVDGAYVDTTRLAVPADNFVSHDLTQPLDLGRRFDLVQSLEVAEHIPENCSDDFVASLCRHGDLVLFSAAVRHQGGEFHVNEQSPEYWRQKFAGHGYGCFDWLRPLIADERTIKPWYRFNTLIYANSAGERRLKPALKASRLPDGQELPRCGDLAWQARRLAVALIPKAGVHAIALLKSAVEARRPARHA
jgi:SAM-dependent methyltransferase